MMVPIDAAARDFVVERFLQDLAAGRADRIEGESLRSELRMIGDVARLERVSREIARRA